MDDAGLLPAAGLLNENRVAGVRVLVASVGTSNFVPR